MEPQNIGSFPHTAASQSQQPPRSRHSAGFEGQHNGGRDSGGPVSRFSVPSSTSSSSSASSAGTRNHNHRRNTTDPSAHNLTTRPNSSFQPRSNPNSTFVPSQQARYMTDSLPVDIYGFSSPRPRSAAELATSTTTPAITASRKANVEAVPFGGTSDVKEPTPRCVRCGTDKLSAKASDAQNGRQEMASNGQGVAASKPANQSAPQRIANEPLAAKANNADQPWPPNAPPPSYSMAQRSSFNDKTDDALFGSNVPNDYERLERRRPNSQHLYRPMNGNDAARPTGTQPQPPPHQPYSPSPPPPPPSPPLPPPPPPMSSADGATSPLYDFCSDKRPESSSPFLQKASNGTYPADGDDIIELQPSANASASAADGARSDRPRAQNEEVKAKLPEITEIPHTNFAIACMVTFCFNLPFGIIAMYFSLRAVKAYQEGNPKLGEKRSRWSIVLSLLGITITTVIISSVVLYIAMQGQKRISKQKTFGAKSSINL